MWILSCCEYYLLSLKKVCNSVSLWSHIRRISFTSLVVQTLGLLILGGSATRKATLSWQHSLWEYPKNYQCILNSFKPNIWRKLCIPLISHFLVIEINTDFSTFFSILKKLSGLHEVKFSRQWVNEYHCEQCIYYNINIICRKDLNGCFDQLEEYVGLTFCGEISVPFDGYKMLTPTNGPSKVSLRIEKENKLSGYHFKVYYNNNKGKWCKFILY